jgi:hypothetical protein
LAKGDWPAVLLLAINWFGVGRWTPYYFVYAWDRVGGQRVWENQTGEILERAPLVVASTDRVFFNVDPPLSAPC